MNNGTIKSKVSEIPFSTLGEVQSDEEIWELDDGNAHFKVTRHHLPPPANLIKIISLSVSGHPHDRARIIKEFTETLGEPVGQNIVPENNLSIDTVMWLDSTDSDTFQ